MNNFQETIGKVYGKRGKVWLENLPLLVEKAQRDYGLSALTLLQPLYHYVLVGFQETRPIILKLGPDIDSLKREGAALKAFTGCGVVQVLALSEGMLLLERAIPGISLQSYFPAHETDALGIMETCMKLLHRATLP